MSFITSKTEAKQLLNADKMSELFSYALKIIKSKGATDASIAISDNAGFSVDVRQNQVENIAFNAYSNLNVVVYFGQKKGVASTNNFLPKAIDNVVEAACAIAKASEEDLYAGLAEEPYDSNTAKDLDLYHPWDISVQEAVNLARRCESEAISLDKRITNSDGATLSTDNYAFGFIDTRGHHGYVTSSRHELSCALMAESPNVNAQRDGYYSVARNFQNLAPVELIAKTAADRTVSKLGAKQISTGRYPVIYKNNLSRTLIACFMQAISGSQLYRKRSFLCNSIGNNIFPDWLTIFEEPYLLGALGSAAFDGDGIATRNNYFVNSGKIMQYALDVYSARKLGMSTTANADGVHNLFVSSNTDTFAELIGEMNTGLLITDLMGSGANIITGDYSIGASGFWVENGIIQYPVDGITIAGNLLDFYKDIVAISKDYDPNSATRCGSILISDVMIGGN